MIKIISICLIVFSGLTSWSADGKGSSMEKHLVKNDAVKMQVGSQSFSVSLIDNESTRRLKEMFPLTIQMSDLHSNEKYYDLPKALPTNASNPRMIKAGDIMLYGTNTLVVFYKSFSTSYSYTKLGQINNPSNLEAALGSGDVTITLGGE